MHVSQLKSSHNNSVFLGKLNFLLQATYDGNLNPSNTTVPLLLCSPCVYVIMTFFPPGLKWNFLGQQISEEFG